MTLYYESKDIQQFQDILTSSENVSHNERDMVVEEGTNSQSQEETFVVSKSDGEVRHQQSLVLGLLSGNLHTSLVGTCCDGAPSRGSSSEGEIRKLIYVCQKALLDSLLPNQRQQLQASERGLETK